MNGFLLKMIRKNSKPRLWKRLYTPGGITFTQLSFILDEMFRLESDPRFGFEFYTCKLQISEGKNYPFRKSTWEYDRREADNTYIDDYLGSQPWFSYYRLTDAEEIAFRVEIEENVINATLQMPQIIKSVRLTSEDDAHWDQFNDMTARKYTVVYAEQAPFLTHDEIRKNLDKGLPLTGSAHPVSAPMDESDFSSAHVVQNMADMLADHFELNMTGREGGKNVYTVPEGLLEKAAWIQRCDYAAFKLYGTCQADEFCRLCRAAEDLDLDDQEIEALFNSIPENERFCVRRGNRYTGKDLVGEKFYRTLLESQKGKPIYYPTRGEIDELWEKDYPASDPVYEMAGRIFRDEIGLSAEQAEESLKILFDGFSYGNSIAEVARLLRKNGVAPSDQRQIETFGALLVMLNNHSRMAIHKGNRLADLPAPESDLSGSSYVKKSEPGRPVGKENRDSSILPAVENANMTSVRAVPKIYPNDPCPCGSGKKYKKCCGRGK